MTRRLGSPARRQAHLRLPSVCRSFSTFRPYRPDQARPLRQARRALPPRIRIDAVDKGQFMILLEKDHQSVIVAGCASAADRLEVVQRGNRNLLPRFDWLCFRSRGPCLSVGVGGTRRAACARHHRRVCRERAAQSCCYKPSSTRPSICTSTAWLCPEAAGGGGRLQTQCARSSCFRLLTMKVLPATRRTSALVTASTLLQLIEELTPVTVSTSGTRRVGDASPSLSAKTLEGGRPWPGSCTVRARHPRCRSFFNRSSSL